jgi:hypothetical protein
MNANQSCFFHTYTTLYTKHTHTHTHTNYTYTCTSHTHTHTYTGANVILTTKGIDDTSLKIMVEHNVIGVRRVPMKDIKSLAKATGATFVLSLVCVCA